MNRFVNLLVVGAVLGSVAEAGDRSLLARLKVPFLRVQGEEPVPTPATEPLPANGITPLPMPEHRGFVDPAARPQPLPSHSRYGGPALGTPGHGGPAFGGPALGGPALGAPAYGGPALGGPAYGGPVLPGPGYAPPVESLQPVHAPSPRVKIEDPENIHPRAVRTVIMVPPPCKCRRCAGCELVPVEICVPPCVCEKHKVRKNGHYQELDFGKYEVEIRVKDYYVEVDYDD